MEHNYVINYGHYMNTESVLGKVPDKVIVNLFWTVQRSSSLHATQRKLLNSNCFGISSNFK